MINLSVDIRNLKIDFHFRSLNMSNLDHLTTEELHQINNDYDFLEVNHYLPEDSLLRKRS